MALMSLQEITAAGLSPVLSAASIQDIIETAGNDRVFLHVANGGGAGITVTVSALRPDVDVEGVGNLAVPDVSVAIAAAGEAFIGPFEKAYRDGAGLLTIDYSDVTSVTSAAFKLARQV